jgi:hypothetical protein
MLSAVTYVALRLIVNPLRVRPRVSNAEAEVVLFRHELSVLRRHVKRPRLGSGDQLVPSALGHSFRERHWAPCWSAHMRPAYQSAYRRVTIRSAVRLVPW